jgi:hypothetical protein
VQLLHEASALAGELEHPHPAVGGMIGTQHELLLLQTIDDVRHRGQRHAEGLGHVAHVAAGMIGHVIEHLRLGVGEIQLGGALPEELPKRRAAQRVQQVEKLLGLGGAGRGRRGASLHDVPPNSLVNKGSAATGRPGRAVTLLALTTRSHNSPYCCLYAGQILSSASLRKRPRRPR